MDSNTRAVLFAMALAFIANLGCDTTTPPMKLESVHRSSFREVIGSWERVTDMPVSAIDFQFMEEVQRGVEAEFDIKVRPFRAVWLRMNERGDRCFFVFDALTVTDTLIIVEINSRDRTVISLVDVHR